ncbi:uncharacterized protein LOC111486567 [Cucurbita maxima]|uniref:Uncharacterized protein LOC111486567 n=1 Tax=Cucurbita maxima TaxID=3661 RepID=A0A6J1JMK0_CUCMA|nr:uncharacterized protein LOC111486567 [Cucurbita maxima]
MSVPLDQLQPPPAAAAIHPAQGSVGPVIAVLAVISILGFIAGMIGRVCFGRPVFGYNAHYDVEDWVEKKCATCLDGSLDPPPLLRPPPPIEAIPVAEPLGGPPNIKEDGDGDKERENLQSVPPGSGGES